MNRRDRLGLWFWERLLWTGERWMTKHFENPNRDMPDEEVLRIARMTPDELKAEVGRMRR